MNKAHRVTRVGRGVKESNLAKSTHSEHVTLADMDLFDYPIAITVVVQLRVVDERILYKQR